jgi:archaellum biogenesis ATPase FlaH
MSTSNGHGERERLRGFLADLVVLAESEPPERVLAEAQAGLARLEAAVSNSHHTGSAASSYEFDSSAYMKMKWKNRIAASFRSPTDLLATTPEDVRWLWWGLLAAGSLTVLAGREKTGKSTLVFGLLQALLSDKESARFLDRACRPAPVVLLTEEPDSAVAEKLRLFNLTEKSTLRLLTRSGLTSGRPRLREAVALSTEEATRTGAEVLILDSFAFWSGLHGDAENQAGAVQNAMHPLLEATSSGLAVLVVHHTTKATGELRGSTALGAAADVILTFSRDRSPEETSARRRLDADGRYRATPSSLLIELEGTRYRTLGSPAEFSREARLVEVLAALPDKKPGATEAELAVACGIPVQRVSDALAVLLERGHATRTGRGVRGNPHRYHLTPPNSIPPLTLS